MKRAIFIDRDGTLIVDKDYLHRPAEVEFFPGALGALKQAVDAGLSIVMVTNQSGVGRGYFTMLDVDQVHAFIAEQMQRAGVQLLKIYVAPEAPNVPSRGRKPSPQFLFDARDDLGIELGQSFMVGDKLIDLQCGWNAGVKQSILVRTGYGAKVEAQSRDQLRDAPVADDLAGAIEFILRGA